ncbi:MAG: HAD hydrolase family protein [[Bacteroides] pectinophilus]|nr:HAD hydrolase family protein [[Bacteroides] pectinophilus]
MKSWWEIQLIVPNPMPITASKSNEVKQLQKLLECEKVISFGDGKNDIDMFKMSDRSYVWQRD